MELELTFLRYSLGGSFSIMTNSNTKKLFKLSAAGFLLTAAACLPMKEAEDNVLKSSTSKIEFNDFCHQAKLTNCDIELLPGLENGAWDAGVDTFKEILNSGSFIELSRSSFSQDSVKSLVNTVGGQGVIAFIDRIPWDTIKVSQSVSGIKLTNDRAYTNAKFNGLTFRSQRESRISPSTGRKFSVNGIYLESALGVETVYEIDLEDPGVIHITTNFGQIRNMPVNFFYVADQMMSKRMEFKPGDLVEAVSDVVLDHNIVYQNSLYISLDKQNITNISKPIMQNIKPGLGKDIAELMLGKARTARVSMTPGSDLISLFSESHTRCTFKLAGHDSAIGIDKIISVANPIKKGDGVVLKVNGVAVTVKVGIFPINGNVEEVYLGPDKVQLKVLGKTFDLNYEGDGKPMEGPKGLTCG